MLIRLIPISMCILLAACGRPEGGGTTEPSGNAPFEGYETIPLKDTAIKLANDSTIAIPKYAGNDKNYVIDSIREKLSFQNITGLTPEEIQSEEGGATFGLIELEYDVLYNADAILSISINSIYMGAHPFYSTEYFNINLQNGAELEIEDIIMMKYKDKLVELCNEKLQENIQIAREENKEYLQDEAVAEFLTGYTFKEKHLSSFCVTDEGINFFYYYSIPHVMRALEPNPNIFVTWGELEPWLRQPDRFLDPVS